MGRVAECLHWPTHNFLLDVTTVSPVFGLEVLGSYRVTVPTRHSRWLLLLSLFFFSSFKAAATSKHILYREVKCTYPPVSRSPSLFRARKRLDATWWWLSHSLSFFFPRFSSFSITLDTIQVLPPSRWNCLEPEPITISPLIHRFGPFIFKSVVK